MKRTPITIGHRNGSLVVREPAGTNRHGAVLWRCDCDCGAETTATSSGLSRTRSCGCSAGAASPDVTGVDPAVFFGRTTARGECRIWNGAMHRSGYGRIRVGHAQYYAHRVAYVLAHGPIPGGLFVCHRCDTPMCVSPDHLFLGTAADNTRDMAAKGRGVPPMHTGERNPRAKLTEHDVRAIRAAAAARVTDLAAHYGVSRRTIGQVRSGDSWAHVARSA